MDWWTAGFSEMAIKEEVGATGADLVNLAANSGRGG